MEENTQLKKLETKDFTRQQGAFFKHEINQGRNPNEIAKIFMSKFESSFSLGQVEVFIQENLELLKNARLYFL
jgi:hypothetical protein